MIIGVVGTLGAGKDEVARYLVTRGATHISLSEEILKEIKKRKISVSRRAYVDVANDLREKISPGVLAKRAMKNLKKTPDFVVVSSLRHPAEAQVILNYPNSHVLAVVARPKIRFVRVKARAKKGDIKFWKDFLEYDREAMKGKNPAHQQIAKSLELADLTVENNHTLQQLHGNIDKILRQITYDDKE